MNGDQQIEDADEQSARPRPYQVKNFPPLAAEAAATAGEHARDEDPLADRPAAGARAGAEGRDGAGGLVAEDQGRWLERLDAVIDVVQIGVGGRP